jgi:O-acetyl-ADP-ribose deacetylase (regulator of RNase III)
MARNKEFEVIAHCANCFCTFGAGIALQIKHMFPEAYEADCATVSGDETKLGSLSFSEKNGLTVVNLYGQFDFRGRRSGKMDVDYDAVRSAIREMKEKFTGKTFGLPKLGSDLAGGDWNVIEKIISEEMLGEYVTIVNYVP